MIDDRTDIETLRARLEGSRGRDYWRSLEAVAETPVFKEFLHREFPQHASEWLDPVGRRGFLKLMGASLALAGVSACTRQPDEVIVPYVKQPEEVVPGHPLFYATAMPMGGMGLGLLVESHEGRPTKIEGNPDHPTSRGATDVFAQAAILGLYDPDRSQTLTHLGDIRPFGAFVAAMQEVLAAQQVKGGSGLRILTETVGSPTLAAQIRELQQRLPAAQWIQWDAAGRHAAREGSRLAFGEYVDAQYAIEKADVLVSIDADFLCSGPGGVRHARAFASRRRIEGDASTMSRFYAIESTPTNTGTKADHRLSLRGSDIEGFTRSLANALGVASAQPGSTTASATAWIAPLVADLKAHAGRALVIAGDGQPPAVHALVHAINEALGNVGTTVVYTRTAEAQPNDQLTALDELVNDMRAGTVDVLLVLGANPVYSTPANLQFREAMQQVALRVHLGLYEDETAAQCHWHIPEAHFLESWGDVRADDGTVTIIQPLIAPLYHGRTAHEVLATISATPERSAYDLVREYWAKESGLSTAPPATASAQVESPVKEKVLPSTPAAAGATGGASGTAAAKVGVAPEAPSVPPPPPVAAAPVPPISAFDRAWRRWLHAGVIQNSAFVPKRVTVLRGFDTASVPTAASGLEVVFRPDPTVHDGRFANNGWLQELPKPLTKLTWDNAALIAPGTAERLHLISGDMVELSFDGRTLRLPVWLAPGHAQDSITLHLGYGRTRAGRSGTGVGFDVNVLRSSKAPFIAQGVKLAKTGGRYDLACTQDHWSLEGRNLVRVGTQATFQRDPAFAQHMEHGPTGLTMYEPYRYDGHAWGMAIDQNVCTGCNACVVACVAENNIPVVGKEQVLSGREMHWLRIDRYYTGDLDAPDTYHQPMLCQHCEVAPCEVVCPVAATVHSDEGLNDMVYNRCVGTRYCSNNCPYKVRRFNFLLYQDFETPQLKMLRNPDVTIRSRGVMEKCTFCVQRINDARHAAIREDRPIQDGDILTACQAACPTQAIVFGDVNDPTSRVSQLKAGPLNYALLAELNTKPRTTYLAVVRNPNPSLEPAVAPASHAPERHGEG